MVSGLRNFFVKHFIACRRYCHCLEEKRDISNLYKIAPEYLTRLPQDSDIILAILFQNAALIKDCLFTHYTKRRNPLSPSLISSVPKYLTSGMGPTYSKFALYSNSAETTFFCAKSPNASGNLRKGLGK